MKPIGMTLLVTLCGLSISCAQGLVNFANTGSTLITTQSTFGTLGNMSGSNAFRIALYVGSLGSPFSSLTPVGLATNSPAPFLTGRFSGGSPFALPAGYPAGQPITFQVRAWALEAGPIWESAFVGADQFGNGGFLRGMSSLGFVTPGDGVSVLPDLFGTGPGQIGGFTMGIPVPEPPYLAITAAGALAFLLSLRHRR